MKIIALNPDPVLLETVMNTFRIENFTDYICFSIPADFNQNDFLLLTNFLKAKVFKNIKRSTEYVQTSQFLDDDRIKFELLDIKDDSKICVDLSIYYQHLDWIIIRSEIFDRSIKQKIGGMKGIIVDFFSNGQEDIFKINFGTQALSLFSENKLKFLIERKMSPFYTYLSSDQILPSIKSDSDDHIQDNQVLTLLKYAPEKIKSHWENPQNRCYYDKQKQIFEYWETLLSNRFTEQKHLIGTTIQKENVKILSIAGSDEKNGVWINIQKNEKELIIPLSNLRRISTPINLNYDLKIYNYWASFFFQ